jgi:AmiR/NasT family two-component response regulator
MDTSATERTDALIVTDNVVEAADIADALAAAGRGEVGYVRQPDAAVELFASGVFAPSVAILSYAAGSDAFAQLMELLTRAQAMIVLIDAPDSGNGPDGAAYLTRPFTESDLSNAFS